MSAPRDPEPPSDPPPEYTLYRSRPRGLGRLRRGSGDPAGEDPRALLQQAGPAGASTRRPRLRRPTVGRVVKWLVLAVVGWTVVSLLAFLISAQIQREQVSDEARDALSGGGFPLTSPTTILVLGSDARTKETSDPGSQRIGQPSRSDTIMLTRVGGDASARLSIPRDTVVDIPGHGRQKINAAYAIGGPALAIRTVEAYTGVEVNHLVEVNFANFPAFIDALGGIDIRTGCVVSRISGGFRNGGYTLRLKPGEHHLDGRAALALARTRKNECRPSENDLTRARRQQKILAAIKGRVASPTTFLRGPWVGWAAPKAIRTDMSGPTLLGLFGALATGGSPPTRILKPTGAETLPDGGAGLTVNPGDLKDEVRRFEGG